MELLSGEEKEERFCSVPRCASLYCFRRSFAFRASCLSRYSSSSPTLWAASSAVRSTRSLAYCSGCSLCGCCRSAASFACSFAEIKERRISSFGARAASVIRRGARSVEFIFISFNSFYPHSSVSPGFVVNFLYSSVFFGNLFTKGTSALPIFMRPCPASAFGALLIFQDGDKEGGK